MKVLSVVWTVKTVIVMIALHDEGNDADYDVMTITMVALFALFPQQYLRPVHTLMKP